MKHPVIETASGISFRPLSPRIEDIEIEDIAHALANQCRFSGHTRFHYSVAQHSVYVSRLIRRNGYDKQTQLWGLLHDASEAYLVDLPSPLKEHPGFAYYKIFERRLMRAVCDRFGLPRREPTAVRFYDARLLATEVRDLMHADKPHWNKLTHAPELDLKIKPWDFEYTKAAFLTAFEAYQ